MENLANLKTKLIEAKNIEKSTSDGILKMRSRLRFLSQILLKNNQNMISLENQISDIQK